MASHKMKPPGVTGMQLCDSKADKGSFREEDAEKFVQKLGEEAVKFQVALVTHMNC